MKNSSSYPVIDLFAGPGGLGEGFASMRHPEDSNQYAFTTAISIEKEFYAHRTLQLRHFFRAFAPDLVPTDYYHYLAGEITLEELYKRHPAQAKIASQTAWQCTLGEEPHSKVKMRIRKALAGQKKWVLVGGPPCQAYSLVGRSRMMGDPNFEDDPRHFLYKEYLRILADHQPPVFVMENVKGLLSAKIRGDYVIRHILRDLSKPGYAIYQRDDGLEYELYSLSESGIKNLDADPKAFVVKAEEYGIPQSRHRIFIVGIRTDKVRPPATLEKTPANTVRDVIGNLPPLRSGLSKSADSDQMWMQTLKDVREQAWFNCRETALGDLVDQAKQVLAVISDRIPERSDETYLRPDHLSEWFYDERLTVLSSHEARSHMPSDLHRYFFAALYASNRNTSPKLQDFPQELLPAHKNVEQGRSGEMFSDRFRVQLPDRPATTITSHIAKDGHYFIHYDPKQCRSLTVREAARLQTFPDNYKFEGNRTAQYHQVGNAVPPLLANKIARVIYEVLEAMD